MNASAPVVEIKTPFLRVEVQTPYYPPSGVLKVLIHKAFRACFFYASPYILSPNHACFGGFAWQRTSCSKAFFHGLRGRATRIDRISVRLSAQIVQPAAFGSAAAQPCRTTYTAASRRCSERTRTLPRHPRQSIGHRCSCSTLIEPVSLYSDTGDR